MRVELARLEIACGHDGLLKGKPEPVVMIGVYVVEPGATRLVVRGLWRFDAPRELPGAATSRHTADIHTGPVPRGARGWAILAVGIEEDAGADVQRVFAALDRPGALSLISEDGAVSTSIEDAPAEPKAHAPRRVHLLVDGVQAHQLCTVDDYVGAAVVAWTGPVPRRAELRMHFSSGERRNDWTAVVTLRA